MELKNKNFINLFRISDERQSGIINELRESSKPDLDFFLLTIFAGIIISLGLILNNGAVIIGGMLLAPLVWPILSLSVGMIRGALKSFENNLLTLFKATALILLISYIIGLLSPFDSFGSEFLSRTEPTLIELFIALAAGFVAAFIISYPGLGNFIAGVVIAAAIVPPLCVTGMSLAEKNLSQAAGSFLLFISNLIAMILSALLFFLLAKFKPISGEESLERRKNNLLWSIIFLVIIIIPLVIITSETINTQKENKIIKEVITSKIADAKISEINLTSENNVLFIDLVMRAKNNLTAKQLDQLTYDLSQALNKSVRLEMIIIPVLEGGKNYQVMPDGTPGINMPSSSQTKDDPSAENLFPEIK